jgi:hypothetical protein
MQRTYRKEPIALIVSHTYNQGYHPLTGDCNLPAIFVSACISLGLDVGWLAYLPVVVSCFVLGKD